MRILIESTFVRYLEKLQTCVSDIISDAGHLKSVGAQNVIIISSKPVSLNHFSYNRIVDNVVLAEILNIPVTASNIELYIVPYMLCIPILYREGYQRVLDDYILSWLYNQPSIIANINFDISFTRTDHNKYIKAKNSISWNFNSDSGLPKYTISINNRSVLSDESNLDIVRNVCNGEFKKLVQLVDSEPTIEAKSLEEQIAELREQVTKTNLLETQIAELREMVSAYFPIREMEKLKLKVAELESSNGELISENAKLKKSIESEKAKSEEVYLAKQEQKNKELADLRDRLNQLLAE
jgi:uncharacterized protein YajQ (UPF0234 family)